jgi:integrase
MNTLTVRPSTRAGYVESLNNYLLPALGHLRIADVKPSRIEALAAALGEKGLHPNTVRKVLDNARVLFAAAVREELIVTNPVSAARRPRGRRAEISPFTPNELRTIIESANELSSGPLIALLAATGCRLGEASALDVADWNPATGTITATKTYSRRFGLGPPKSVYSRRRITVPVIVRPLLIAAAGVRPSGPLFVTRNGNRVEKSIVQVAFTRQLRRLGFARRNVHQLRHSVATALISAGTPIGDVAKYLGDSVATVVKSYLHPSGSNPGVELDRILAGSEPRAVKWARTQPPTQRENKFLVIRWIRGSGPCGRPLWTNGRMCPGGELSPIAQKMVEALNTVFPFGPG